MHLQNPVSTPTNGNASWAFVAFLTRLVIPLLVKKQTFLKKKRTEMNWRERDLGVAVQVARQKELAERGPEFGSEVLVHHGLEHDGDGQALADLLDADVVAPRAHLREELQPVFGWSVGRCRIMCSRTSTLSLAKKNHACL